MKIFKYSSEWKEAWDDLVSSASNSALIHFREYLEYHSDRFNDHSLLCLQDGKLLAIFPASISGSQLNSHSGLTFGGWIYPRDLATDQLERLDQVLLEYCLENDIQSLEIKEIPEFFQWKPAKSSYSRLLPATEFSLQSKIFYAVPLPAQIRDRGKSWGVRKAKNNGLSVQKSGDWKSFWELILVPNLWQRHKEKPVHSLGEITALAEKFPESIQLWTVGKEGHLLGGGVLFFHHSIIHCQYLSASSEGKGLRAVDLLMTSLIEEFKDFSFLSLGTAINPKSGTEDQGLVSWKKSWGAKSYSTSVWNVKISDRMWSLRCAKKRLAIEN